MMYEKLKELFKTYVARKQAQADDLEEKHASIQKELATLQKELATAGATMKAEEFREKEQRMNELFVDTEFYEKRQEQIDGMPAASPKEIQDFLSALYTEYGNIEAEYSERLLEALAGAVEVTEQAITEYEKLRALEYAFRVSIEKHYAPVVNTKTLSGLMKGTSNFLLSVYNGLAKVYGKAEMYGYNAEEVTKELVEIHNLSNCAVSIDAPRRK